MLGTCFAVSRVVDMEALFKKYFWALNLLFLAGIAYIVASTTVDFLASKVLQVDSTPEIATVTAGNRPLLQKANDGSFHEDLIDWHPFNVDQYSAPKKTTGCKPKCDDRECGNDGCGGTCGDCEKRSCNEDSGKCEEIKDEPQSSTLPISLIGTIVHPADPSVRYANITVEGGKGQVVAVGTEIEVAGSSEGAKVIDIRPKVLYLREGTKLTYRTLWDDPPKASRPYGRRPSASRTKRPTPSSRSTLRRPRPYSRARFDYSKGVKKINNFEFEISKKMLDEQLVDLTQLGREARVIPNYRGGRYEGFKLVGVKSGSLYRAIGIRSGDIIRAINGDPIDSPNKAMQLFNKLKTSPKVTLDIVRRRKNETFSYTIK
jgi:hypothetical protein